MPDSQNQERPVRKLTVKNFSVIKEAELEFGKITVLIGPQASGKSLLCKLAYFLGRVVIERAIEHATHLSEFSDFKSSIEGEFAKWFPSGGWGRKNWSLEFRAGEYCVAVSEEATTLLTSKPDIAFTPDFESAYTAQLKEFAEGQKARGFLLGPAVQSIAATKFMKVAGCGVWDSATYIPLERSFFVDMQKGYRALANDAEPITARFAVTFGESLNREIPKRRVNRFLNGDVAQLLEGLAISFPDGRLLPLDFLSSGSKEMLPILSVLDLYEFRRRSSGPDWLGQELYGNRLYEFDELTIEEPEASVFPTTQQDLVREFAALSNETGFQPAFTITTHSPYILTAFNTLIEAWRVGNKEGKREQVAAIVPEKYWVSEDDFAAYAMRDGVLVPIFEKETEGKEGSGLIDGDYLDAVSDQIGGEFEKLLDIEYAN